WILPAIPAASFLLILAFGKRMPRGGSEIGIAAVGAAFVLSLFVGGAWIDRVNNPPASDHGTEHVTDEGHDEGHADEEGAAVVLAEGEHAAGPAVATALATAEEGAEAHHETPPVTNSWVWWQSGGTEFTVGTMVDGLSAVMLFVVGLISLLVHV